METQDENWQENWQEECARILAGDPDVLRARLERAQTLLLASEDARAQESKEVGALCAGWFIAGLLIGGLVVLRLF